VENGVLLSFNAYVNWVEPIVGKLVIPSSVTSIGEWAFYGCEPLTEVTIPSSVTSIGELAFAECTGLTATIQGSDVTIGNSAFQNVPTVYYNGAVPSDKWGATQVLPLQ